MERIRKPDARDGWYRISPASAQKLLEAGHKNRPLNEARAEFIGRSIRDGRYVENGESIVLDDNERILDGQHRMRAVVLGGKTAVFYIVHIKGPSQAIFDSMDCGKTRSHGDRLALEGVKNSAMAAAITRLIITYERGVAPSSLNTAARLSTQEIYARYRKDADGISDAIHLVVKHQRDLRQRCQMSVAGFAMFFALKQAPEKAAAFFAGVCTGENLALSSPAMALRNRLLQNAASKSKLPAREMQALWVIAWNYYRDERPTKIIKWDERSPFPSLDETAAA